ncbi:unnamed protein product, partial [Didymodactylos carnosus]
DVEEEEDSANDNCNIGISLEHIERILSSMACAVIEWIASSDNSSADTSFLLRLTDALNGG